MTQLLEHLGISEKGTEEEVSLDELTQKIRGVEEEESRTARPPVGFPIPSRMYSDQESIHRYWVEERKLEKHIVSMYNLGYDTLSDEAIIPVTDFNRNNIGMIRRTFDPSRPRYLYSKGMKISEVVFGAHEAMKYASVNVGMKGVLVITEGSVDAMSISGKRTVGKNGQSFYAGVAVLGSRISRTQALEIKKLGFEEIVIATDMDRAGRTAAIQIQTMLKDIKCASFISIASWDSSFKDLNSLLCSSKDNINPVLAPIVEAVNAKNDMTKRLLSGHTPAFHSTSGNGSQITNYSIKH
jgi:5S rRNA maturation endonuclease (ribonuclease M5)